MVGSANGAFPESYEPGQTVTVLYEQDFLRGSEPVRSLQWLQGCLSSQLRGCEALTVNAAANHARGEPEEVKLEVQQFC